MSSENAPVLHPHDLSDESSAAPPCVLVFNANDPSGAGGVGADVLASASVGAHALPVVTGAYMRDTAEIFDHVSFDEDAVAEQARSVLEDVSVQVIKVGFCGNPENLSVIAEVATDYAEVPVVAYMPNLSWWGDEAIDAYLDAFRELILPQTTLWSATTTPCGAGYCPTGVARKARPARLGTRCRRSGCALCISDRHQPTRPASRKRVGHTAHCFGH